MNAIQNGARQFLFLITAASLFGCSVAPAPAPTLAQPTNTAQPAATFASQTFSDAFAYCAAVGNADTPDARYTGEKIPSSVVQNLRKILSTPADAPNEIFLHATFWRCMNGKVYACFVGANLPCEAKAKLEKTPTQAEKDFCKQNPSADIPAAVTGRETVYAWHCNNGAPEIVKQVSQVDARGFIAEIWHELKAN